MKIIRILKLINDKKNHEIEIQSILQLKEFKSLKSELNDVHVFSEDCMEDSSRVIKTGKRSQCASYLLLPKKLQNKFKTTKYDFSHLEVGHMKAGNHLFVIYEVPEKGFGSLKK